MADGKSIRKLGDVVIAGRDYPAKVKILEVLDHEVVITDFDHVVIQDEKPNTDGELVKVVTADYYNVIVDDNDVLRTFSTGAQPIVKILDVLDKDDLPLLATFHKEGQTYVVK
uniref:Uncharacterized protein n=1 Tax=viral metagenome TaxID=1070528 RepID=A0A6H1ZV65_9ZZZZ